jgi:hypothetical protein
VNVGVLCEQFVLVVERLLGLVGNGVGNAGLVGKLVVEGLDLLLNLLNFDLNGRGVVLRSQVMRGGLPWGGIAMCEFGEGGGDVREFFQAGWFHDGMEVEV